jgi:sugar phosphate isomerase/epimerase
MNTRRSFFGTAVAATAAATLTTKPLAAIPIQADDLKLGIASYSFRKFSREQAIKNTLELGTRYISIKDFHAPRSAASEELALIHKEFTAAGLQVMSGGNITLTMETEAELRAAYQYAKDLGLPMMVCAPSVRNIPICEKLAKEFKVKLAIHNHGPEDKHFPTPESILKEIEGRDPRLGVCIDVGHTTRTGVNVVESIKRCGPRLFDFHIKDLSDLMVRESQVDVGDGSMPVALIFKTLLEMNYRGNVNLEYEINVDNPMPGMHRSFAYMRGILAGLRAS